MPEETSADEAIDSDAVITPKTPVPVAWLMTPPIDSPLMPTEDELAAIGLQTKEAALKLRRENERLRRQIKSQRWQMCCEATEMRRVKAELAEALSLRTSSPPQQSTAPKPLASLLPVPAGEEDAPAHPFRWLESSPHLSGEHHSANSLVVDGLDGEQLAEAMSPFSQAIFDCLGPEPQGPEAVRMLLGMEQDPLGHDTFEETPASPSDSAMNGTYREHVAELFKL